MNKDNLVVHRRGVVPTVVCGDRVPPAYCSKLDLTRAPGEPGQCKCKIIVDPPVFIEQPCRGLLGASCWPEVVACHQVYIHRW